MPSTLPFDLPAAEACLVPAPWFAMPPGIVDRCLGILREHTSSTLDAIPHDAIARALLAAADDFLRRSGAFRALSDDNIGFATIGYDVPVGLDLQTSILLYAAVFALVNKCAFDGLRTNTRVPFDLFKSTVESAATLRRAGVKFYSPNEKLGFHNDVYFDGKGYFVPKYVSLVNLFIGYDQPGNFYYINNRIWSDFEKIFSKGVGQDFKFRPTPSFYESELLSRADTSHSPSREWATVRAFWQAKDGRKYCFSNGELTDLANTTAQVVEEMKTSLLSNERKIFVPQSVGMISIFRNDIGFHSRDIFQEQRVSAGATRMFLRAVSFERIDVPTAE